LSPRTIGSVLLLVSHILSESYTTFFYSAVDIQTVDPECLYSGIVKLLSNILQFQRKAVLESPAAFCIFCKDLMTVFLEPTRYAKNRTFAPSVNHGPNRDHSEGIKLHPCLPVPLLNVLGPLPSSSAAVWGRLLSNFFRLSTVDLNKLKSTSDALITPMKRHLIPIVTDFIIYDSFAIPFWNPMQGWTVNNSDVKRVLVNALFGILDICKEFDVENMLDSVPQASKTRFKEFYSEYERGHKYKGKV
jgi:hypothetical protein